MVQVIWSTNMRRTIFLVNVRRTLGNTVLRFAGNLRIFNIQNGTCLRDTTIRTINKNYHYVQRCTTRLVRRLRAMGSTIVRHRPIIISVLISQYQRYYLNRPSTTRLLFRHVPIDQQINERHRYSYLANDNDNNRKGVLVRLTTVCARLTRTRLHINSNNDTRTRRLTFCHLLGDINNTVMRERNIIMTRRRVKLIGRNIGTVQCMRLVVLRLTIIRVPRNTVNVDHDMSIIVRNVVVAPPLLNNIFANVVPRHLIQILKETGRRRLFGNNMILRLGDSTHPTNNAHSQLPNGKVGNLTVNFVNVHHGNMMTNLLNNYTVKNIIKDTKTRIENWNLTRHIVPLALNNNGRIILPIGDITNIPKGDANIYANHVTTMRDGFASTNLNTNTNNSTRTGMLSLRHHLRHVRNTIVTILTIIVTRCTIFLFGRLHQVITSVCLMVL